MSRLLVISSDGHSHAVVVVVVMLSPPSGQTAQLRVGEALTFGVFLEVV